MSDGRYAKAYKFRYEELVPALVLSVYPIDQDRRLFVQVAALDGRAVWKALVVGPLGVSRNMRKGMTVGLLFRLSISNWPVVICSIVNVETDPSYTNPLPPPHQNIDDQVYYHPETGAFMRMRNTGSSASMAAPDGSAGIFEATMASGMSIKLSEYPQSGSPLPAPNRGTASVTMPSGARLEIDEPAVGHATFSLTLPSGFSMTVAVNGDVAINSPTEVAINAPHVTTGGPNGSGKALAFLDDLQRVVDAYDSHTHPDEGGAPPTTPAPNPIGTQNTVAV